MNPELSAETDLTSRFVDTIAAKDFDTLEEIWTDALDEPSGLETGPFVDAADALIDASLGDKADVLLELTLPAFEGRLPEERLDLLRRWCLAAPEREDAREGFEKTFREAYGPSSVEVLYFELAGVRRAADIAKAFRMLDRWMRYRAGSYVHHESGWGTGRIESIDVLTKRATVNLERRPNHAMDVEAMGSVLEPLSNDHFLALTYEGGEKLREMFESDPVALIDTVLMSFRNPMPLKNIKSHLIPDTIPDQAWTKWWTKTKKLLRASGYYRIGDRAPYNIERVKKAISYEDELTREYEAASWSVKKTLAKKTLRSTGRSQPRFTEVVIDDLRKIAGGKKLPLALEAACLLERSGRSAEGGTVADLLRKSDDPIQSVLDLGGADDQRVAAAALRELRADDWDTIALKLLEEGLDGTRELVCELVGSDDALRKRVHERLEAILDNPRPAPALFVWMLKQCVDGKSTFHPRPLEEVATLSMVGRLFDLFDQLTLRAERDGDQRSREVMASLRALLQHKSKAFFAGVVKQLDVTSGRAIYERIRDHSALTEALRIELLDFIVKAIPKVQRPPDVPIWEEKKIYVTPSGLAKHEEELRTLMEDTLPEVFEDIGRAAAFGDLRENAEYKAALEKRETLTKKGEKMRAELDLVSLITPEMLKDGVVTLGSRISVRDSDTGQTQTYSILGPWDGGPEEGVVSYKSPLARSFLGAKVGDTVTVELPAGTQNFDLLSIESALDGAGES